MELNLKFLSKLAEQLPFSDELDENIEEKRLPVVINGAGGVHKLSLCVSLCEKHGKKALYLCTDESEGTRAVADFETLGMRAAFFPVRDLCFRPLEGLSREVEHSRIEILCKLIEGELDIVVTVPDALSQLTVSPDQLKENMIVLRQAEETDTKRVVSALIAGGYERADAVEGAGQFSVRGGIIDFFPTGSPYPIRAELWGDEIDTLSYFDPQTQRRTDDVIDYARIYPASELVMTDAEVLADKIFSLAKGLRAASAAKARERLFAESDSIRGGAKPASLDKYLPLLCPREATLLDYFEKDTLFFVSEYGDVKERLRASTDRQTEEIKALLEDGTLCKGLTRFFIEEGELAAKLAPHAIFMSTFTRGGYEMPLKGLYNLDAVQRPVWDGDMTVLFEDLSGLISSNYAVALMAGSDRSADSLCGELCELGIEAYRASGDEPLSKGKVAVIEGTLSSGFELPFLGVALLSWGRTFAKKSKNTPQRKKKPGDIQSLSELNVGDYVVHVGSGIGIFGGIVKMGADGVVKDYIKISYAKGDVLYVPVTQLDMVSKYIGAAEDGGVRISTLGSGDWERKKSRTRKAVKDIAKELIKLYAERMRAEGYPFDPDGELQRDFECKFEYEETEDQLRCVNEIKGDMERMVPMERLLCGDVGVGKTEVAMRAAHKCVVENRQCAILAPTTILAWQHYQTALERFRGTPFRIELLSRYRSEKQQKAILEKLKRGDIDILIGTHRIIQKDVIFRDLGLAIIDEEQRFGVAHKERFKECFKGLDVLYLSATPIPRTLNMALSGLKDISIIEQAPHDRLPVQTFVMEHDPAIVADVLRRELRRGGQCYYLHNKVSDIENCAAKLQKMLPEARIAFAHGQMNEQEISREWKKLIDRETDILVCTTIIESGVDVSNANTIIVENADHFGLSQLHQLRGRVGRSSRRAYAYFTFNGRKELSEIATKRLSAIKRFTEFGSGMKIALRDLELRGAGNVLGAEQSGHLDMVGYDLYMKMLAEAVAEEKGEVVRKADAECTIDLPIEAHIPEYYIESTQLRLDCYRLIADIRDEEDAMDVTDELIDRFGDPPQSVMGLIRIALVRNEAAALGISEIKQNGGNMLFFFDNPDMERISKMATALSGRVLLSVGNKCYLTLRPDKKLSVIENLCEAIKAFALRYAQ